MCMHMYMCMRSFMMPVKFEWCVTKLGFVETAESFGLLAPKVSPSPSPNPAPNHNPNPNPKPEAET